MNQRLKLFRVLGVSALAGALVGCLILTIDIAANSAEESHGHGMNVPRCDDLSDASLSKFYSEITQVNARMHTAMEIPPSGDVDRDFARMMIPHHQGAIDMALVLLKHGRDEKLKRLAQSIIVEQTQEIAYMRRLLAVPAGETFKTNSVADQ